MAILKLIEHYHFLNFYVSQKVTMKETNIYTAGNINCKTFLEGTMTILFLQL